MRMNLDDAIAAAQRVLLDAQSHDGRWDSRTDMGPGLVAAWIVTERHLGVLTREEAMAGARTLALRQHEDGGFVAHPRAAHGDLTTTRLCIAAMRIAESEPDAVRRAEEFVVRVRAPGSDLDTVSELQFSFLSLFLILAGALGPAALPRLPIEAALVPGLDALIDRRVHAGNIVALLTLIAVADARREGPRGLLRTAARAVARARIVAYLESQQNPDGSWNSTVMQTLTLVVGYVAAGLSVSDVRVGRALAFIDRHKTMRDGAIELRPFHADVWCTAHAMVALAECGEVPTAAIEGGARHLLRLQSQTPQPRYAQPKVGVVRIGGWPFEAGNTLLPDCDDTGVALEGLGATNRDGREASIAVRQGFAWLDAMQNPDGGWSAYVWGLPGKAPGPAYLDELHVNLSDPSAWLRILRDPPTELGDPSWEDVTGRVLAGLGACGHRSDEPMVKRAIAFLAAQQCGTGAWWGRWIACYVPGTASVLIGLAAVGVDPTTTMVQRAVAWLESRQNDDGGWGEVVEVYRNPQLAGRGASNACATGMAVTALVRCGRANEPAVARGVDYLLATIGEHGQWSNDDFLHPLVPPDSHYEFGISAMVYPLRALAAYRRAVRG